MRMSRSDSGFGSARCAIWSWHAAAPPSSPTWKTRMLHDCWSYSRGLGRWAELGWEVVSLDLDPSAEPTICTDVCSWEPMPVFAPGYFDMIWASPPCAEYSRALTRRPRRVEEGDRAAVRTLELIRDLRLRFWCIENPQTGLLKRWPFMANLPLSDVTYCKYGFAYKKATRLWRN